MSFPPPRRDGSAFKRSFNAVRNRPAPRDPFFSDVILLLPLSGSGQTFVDYSPIAADNTLAIQNANAGVLFEQNSSSLLFGLPTLNCVKTSAAVKETCLEVLNSTRQLGKIMCMEFWLKVNSSTQLSIPNPTMVGIYDPATTFFRLLTGATSQVGLRTYINSVNFITRSPFLSLDLWQYIVVQNPTANLISFWVNGAPLLNNAGEALTTTARPLGFQSIIGGRLPSVAATNNLYNFSIANVRLTQALRYTPGEVIPVPSAPFPTQ